MPTECGAFFWCFFGEAQRARWACFAVVRGFRRTIEKNVGVLLESGCGRWEGGGHLLDIYNSWYYGGWCGGGVDNTQLAIFHDFWITSKTLQLRLIIDLNIILHSEKLEKLLRKLLRREHLSSHSETCRHLTSLQYFLECQIIIKNRRW